MFTGVIKEIVSDVFGVQLNNNKVNAIPFHTHDIIQMTVKSQLLVRFPDNVACVHK